MIREEREDFGICAACTRENVQIHDGLCARCFARRDGQEYAEQLISAGASELAPIWTLDDMPAHRIDTICSIFDWWDMEMEYWWCDGYNNAILSHDSGSLVKEV